MLSLLLLLILIASFFIGVRRGIILQLIHFLSIFVSLFIAFYFYKDFAEFLRLWLPYPRLSNEEDGAVSMLISAFNMESVYYFGISFAILFFATKILFQVVGSMFDMLAQLPILHSINRLLGGVLCFTETYIILFILLIAAALLPISQVQAAIGDSTVAFLIIEHTPFLSDWVQDLWSEEWM